jgi:ribosomal protein S18 acetylase RimI-like enzyme
MQVQFCEASVSDLEKLTELMRRYYQADGLRFDHDRALAAFQELLCHSEFGRVWMIETGGDTAGYVVLCYGFSMEYGGRDAILDDLYLEQAYRGQGIGKLALKYVEEHCEKAGICAIHLEVSRSNTIAQELYRKAGFVDHDHYLLTKWISQR